MNGDLTIADQYMSQILERTEDRLEALGASVRFQSLVQDPPSLGVFLEESRLAQGLDFLYLVGVAGQVEAAAPPAVDPRQTDWPIIRAALSGVPATSIDLYQTEDLAAISPKLAERSRFDLVATPNAIATDRRQETRGMIIHSAAPVMIRGADAALVGGILLNRNLVFIDTINDLVYRKASLPEGSVGTATLFLDDVRVSTNVRLFEGSRALGTRVSAEVRKSVLDEGRTWLDRAFVVNDWYISAYEPLVDSYGRRIGMLYVGFLEAPFQRTKTETMLTIVVAFLAISAASIPFMLRWARGIFKPLERMSRTIASVEQGDLSARTGLPPAGDEIGRVAGHLDDLLDRLQQRERSLREWNDELNR
ncbi:MAG: cache domain-containing protein, partial [Pseudomonadota bacterium]